MTAASLAGILVFLVGAPAVTVGLFALPQYRRLFLAAMVFTTCYVKKPFYQEVFFVNYRGVDRGFAVTLPDLFFFGFFLWMVLGGLGRRVRWLPFNSVSWLLLTIVSCVSLVGSLDPFIGSFTIHKMIRCWVLYVVVVNVVESRRDVEAVLVALASAVILQGAVVFWDKYVTQSVVARSVGTFRHPNSLAMYVDLVLPVLLGALLAGKLAPRLQALFAVALVAGFISVLFTKSRAAMLLLPASLGVLTGTSILFKPSGRKMAVLAAGMVAVLVIGSLALPRLIRRFESAPKESAETREYFNHAAKAMADDRFFGVGINLYSLALNTNEYYWYVYPDMVEVADPEGFRESVRGQSRLGTAHHIYWLYAAETGYIGAVLFCLFIALNWLYAAMAFLREKEERFRGIYLGVVVGTAFFHLHGVLEWIFRQTEVMYLYFILSGMVVAMVSMRKRERAAAARRLRRRKHAPRRPRFPVGTPQPPPHDGECVEAVR